MKKLVNDVITLNLKEIDSYDFPIDKVFGLEVINKGIKFCFIIKFSSTNKNLICCAPVAHPRNSKTSSGKLIKPPYFDRWSWYKYFDESFIAFADPIFFYDEIITVGWFVGDKNQWYLETISEIIMKLSKKQKILQNNILFYSSSGGGFASVCLGTLIKGSKVIIDNSQLFIMNFHEGDINNLFNILFKEFPGLSKSEIIDKINYRLNVIELFKKYQYMPPIHYYVNLESDEDLFDQYIPFIKELKKLKFYTDNLTVFLYRDEKEKPHAPLPTDTTVNIIKSFSQNYLYNHEESEDNNLINNINARNILLNNQILELKNKINFLINNSNITEKELEKKESYIPLKNKHDVDNNKHENIKISQRDVDHCKNEIKFSEMADFRNIIVHDYATLPNHNDNTYMLLRGNLERTNDGTILTGNYGDLFFTPIKNEYYYDFPIALELIVVNVKDSKNIRLQAYSNKQNFNINFSFDELNIKKNNKLKMVYNGSEIKIFINDKLKSTKKVTFTDKFRIGIQTFSDIACFKYKNIILYRLN